VGGGLVPLQILSTIKKDTIPINFQSNELFSMFYNNKIKWSSQNFYPIHFRKARGVGGGGIDPPVSLKLKKGTTYSDNYSNEPPSKFLRSPFLYIPYMAPGYNS